MKNIFFILLAVGTLISCSNYDDQFDELNSKIEQLVAENAALEAQILGVQAASASSAAATAARLAEFQSAVSGIVDALAALGTASASTVAQVSEIIAAIAELADLVASNTATNEELESAIALIDSLLEDINEKLYDLHHSGGGGGA